MQIGLFPHQLPAAVSDFVGREELVQSAVDLITPFPQVVLLTGPIGAGKTTLAVHAAEALGDHAGLGLAYRNLGIVSSSSGDLMAARQWYQRSLAVYERLGDPVGQASVLQNRGPSSC